MSQEDPFTIDLDTQDFAAIDRQLAEDECNNWDSIELTEEDLRNIGSPKRK